MQARRTMHMLFLFGAGAWLYFGLTTDYRTHIRKNTAYGVPAGRATLLAFGDVNLGRTLGRQLLREGPGCVFDEFRFDTADVVFVNLESTLSDQGGETESPESNYIFTGPPVGALALARAGITVVATANNHAYDYGERALKETIDHLDAANIGHAGTSKEEETVLEPLCLTANGMKFAFFAVTDFMNMGYGWRRHAAAADSARLFPKLREAAGWADAVIVSVHGGDEYADVPSARVSAFMRACIDQGAMLVLGHHPHVPYGIDSVRGGYIVSSLGNFVFSQPQREWTQLSYGVLFEFTRAGRRADIRLRRVIPIETGFRPLRMDRREGREKIMARAQQYSSFSLKQFY